MTWTGIARQEHSRKGLRYSSDMTDREWSLAEPFIPPAKRGGRRRHIQPLRTTGQQARSLAERRCDRQPVRENHRKRRPLRV